MYQQPPGGSGWGGVQHAHQRITELEEKFSSMKVDIATIKEGMLTEQKMREILDWGPRREEQTYRGWQNATYQQMQQMPGDMRARQGLALQADQTRTYHMQTALMVATPFISAILSILIVKLMG